MCVRTTKLKLPAVCSECLDNALACTFILLSWCCFQVHLHGPEWFKVLLQWFKNTYQRHRLCTVLLDVFIDHVANCCKHQPSTESECNKAVEKPSGVWLVRERTK